MLIEYLVIRLGETGAAHWIAVDNTGARLGPPSSGLLSAAAAAIGDRKVIVLVPGVEILTTTVDIPLKSAARIQAALPFALEESVADDVDKLHFAAGPRRENGQIPVSVVRRDKLQAWIDGLHEAGISPTSIIADNQGLARIPGTISLLFSENQLCINDGGDTELVLQGFSPGDGLAAIGAFDNGQEDRQSDAENGAADTPRHVLVYCEAGVDERYSQDWIGIRHDFDSVDIKILPDGILPRLAVTVATGVGVNLLQGEFGAKTEYASLFQPWKVAAILLLAFTVTMFASKSVDYYKLRSLEAQLQERFLAEYRQIVPGATDIRDPLAAVSSLRARAAGSGSDSPELLLHSLRQLSRAMQRNQTAHIEAISFRGGVVDIRLSAPSVAVLDSIRQIIDESGTFAARILSTDQDGDVVNSRIQIQANGT